MKDEREVGYVGPVTWTVDRPQEPGKRRQRWCWTISAQSRDAILIASGATMRRATARRRAIERANSLADEVYERSMQAALAEIGEIAERMSKKIQHLGDRLDVPRHNLSDIYTRVMEAKRNQWDCVYLTPEEFNWLRHLMHDDIAGRDTQFVDGFPVRVIGWDR